MSDTEALDDFIYSLAQAIILFGPIADSRYEYTASDICKHLNPSRVSRRQPYVVYESDLETGLSESRIRNSLKSIFPLQLEFHRNAEGRGASTRNFYKIKFLVNPDVRAFTIDSLAAAIAGNIEAEVIKKRKRPIKAPAAASAASPAPALPSTILPASAPMTEPAPEQPAPAPESVDPTTSPDVLVNLKALEELFSWNAATQVAIVRKYLGSNSLQPIKAKIGNNKGATFFPFKAMVVKSSVSAVDGASKIRLAYKKRMPDSKVITHHSIFI